MAGRFDVAWDRFEAEWPLFRRSALYQAALMRGRMLALGAVLSSAGLDAWTRTGAGPASRAELGKRLRRQIRGLDKSGQAWARAEARRFEAVLALAAGDLEGARDKLELGAQAFAKLGMQARALACRARHAQLGDDGPGAAAALEQLAVAGLAEPEAWLAAQAPGFARAGR